MWRALGQSLVFLILVTLGACASSGRPPLAWSGAQYSSQLVPVVPQPGLPASCQLKILVSNSVPDTDMVVTSTSDTKPPALRYNPRRVLQSIVGIIETQQNQMALCPNFVNIESLTVDDYARYPEGFNFWSPFFGVSLVLSNPGGRAHAHSAKYSAEVMAPMFFQTSDAKTQAQLTRAANTAVYYGVLYGAYDVEKCSECNLPMVLIYEKFGNQNWIRVKRLSQ